MKVIELIGLPGSGKTTFTRLIVQNNPEKYISFRKIEDTSIAHIDSKKYFKKTLRIKYFFTFIYMFIRSDNEFKKERKTKEIIKDLWRLFLYIEIYNSSEIEDRVVISDQGILQEGICYFLEHNNYRKIIPKLLGFLDDPKNLSSYIIENSIEKSILQIKKRNRKQVSMDFYSDEKLFEYLYQINKALSEVENYIEILDEL